MERNSLSLSNYVTVTQNNSKHFSPDEIVHICKRKNNSKRDFLFVNAFQGKHLAVSPTTAFTLYEDLASTIRSSISFSEKVVVVGFAETATAIGHYIASSLENCISYMQTTREHIPDVVPLLEFQEEHSHATEQLLYGSLEILNECDRILFVDDEISTGNTILNFIHALAEIGIKSKYSVASFLNWQNEEWTQKFEELSISTCFVVRGTLQNLMAKVQVATSAQTVSCIPPILPPTSLVRNCNVSNFRLERLGASPLSFERVSQALYSELKEELRYHLPNSNDEVLILGTEEFMFAPLVFGKMLQENHTPSVYFHATTRSPIETSDAEDYAISKRFSIRSCYNSLRNTFVYNLKRYDKVYIITDVIPGIEFTMDIVAALMSAGTAFENIYIIILKG